MDGLQLPAGTILAHDIVAFTDAELDQYLEAILSRAEQRSSTSQIPTTYRPPSFNGSGDGVPLPRLSRLVYSTNILNRDRARSASHAARSRPVDLDQVNARLLQRTPPRYASPQPTSSLPSPADSHATLPASPPENYKTRSYHELISDGGRPSYPISLLDDVANNPGAYREILLPWQDWPDADPPQWEEVFAKQKQHWWEFRQWQALNRTKGPPTIVRDDPHVDVYIVFYRHFRRTSPNYAEALKKLLGQYGFTVVCQLHDDPAHQDELTTWVEYLGYACAAHYRHNRLVERSQPKYDEAWKALVNTGVLRPSETQEYLHNITSAFDHQAEEEQARQDAELAESAVNEITRKSHGAPGNAEQTLRWELAAAQSALGAARRRLESTRRRNRLVTDFIVSVRGYTSARRAARRGYAVMQWILGQVPLVAAEAKKSETATEGWLSTRHDDGSSGRDEEPLGGKQSLEQMGHEESAYWTGGRAASLAQTRSAHGCADSGDTEGDGSSSKRARKNINVGVDAATVPEQQSSCQQKESTASARHNAA